MSQSHISHSPRNNLAQWLNYLESIHATEIDLGLNRITLVAQRLSIDFSFAKVITVAGTNGKGTTCAFLENALLAENKSVAVYSSPHIEQFNERLRINKVDIADQPLIDAFNLIEKARGDTSLTYYEYTTLACFIILTAIRPDFIILEVGLGGRLDATNMMDADIAVITTIDLDHQAFLGDSRELIGFEKAGIMRAHRLAILGDTTPPQSILKHAEAIKAQLKVRGIDFSVKTTNNGWQWSFDKLTLNNLAKTNIPQDNVATALSVLQLLNFELNSAKVNQLIKITKVPGRTELFKGEYDVLLDVAHNPQAARYLEKYLIDLIKTNKYQRIYAVVGMLADKDVVNTLLPMVELIDEWYIGSLSVPRAATGEFIVQQLKENSSESKIVNCFDNVSQAFKIASKNINKNDLIVVFGSFFTVAEIRRVLL
ncbi:MAG: bifunctional tetrahydrofolate synthase/dihydrofolate synthase [Colwellia sp.]|nr:bifunctional tetrahydrofolate synthase/dihydrofolate synthase [Colwellia sp.]